MAENVLLFTMEGRMTMIINIEKFISSLIERSSGITQQIFHSDLLNALKEQGLEYKDGEIVKTQRRIAAEAKEAIFDDKDEKVRKAILEGLIDCRDAPDLGWTNFGGIKIDDCIAWLEKQGEEKRILDFKASNWYVSKVDGKIHDLTYNPTDKKELKKLTQPVTKISDKVWSEEDEENLISCIDAINKCYKWDKIINWLKSLKERLGE